jgi:hypothetical protein
MIPKMKDQQQEANLALEASIKMAQAMAKGAKECQHYEDSRVLRGAISVMVATLALEWEQTPDELCQDIADLASLILPSVAIMVDADPRMILRSLKYAQRKAEKMEADRQPDPEETVQ